MADVPHNGLFNLPAQGYINAALQGILAVPMFVTYLEEDKAHQKQCKTLLKCVTCALSKLWEQKKLGLVQNAAFFVHKWRDSSCKMTHEQQCDPFEILMFIIYRLRLEYVQRKDNFTLEDLHTAPVAEIFQGQRSCIVSCPSCGSSPWVEPFMLIEVSLKRNGLVSSAVTSHFQKEFIRLCPTCYKLEGLTETVCVKYPKNMVIHINKYCPTSKLELEFEINLEGNNFRFLCCLLEVVRPEKPTRYICCAMCQDGQLRLYEDVKVTVIRPGTLMMSKFWTQSKVTMVYEASRSACTGPVASCSSSTKKSGSFGSSYLKNKCMVLPEIDCCDVLEEPLQRLNIGTMTDKSRVVTFDKAVQTDPPFFKVSYEICRTSEKFKFFTGLLVEDFEALYELIGGDDIVTRLKRQYEDTTPQKLKKSKLSGKDRLFMFLIRLRRGLPLEELAFMFEVHVSYVSRICYVMTRHVYETFKSMAKDMFASAEHQRKGKPPVMKPFKNLRVIIDGASFYTEAPSNFEMQGNTFSRYKSHNVLIFLIGVSCSGATIFCSPDFEGAMSDKECALQSGLLDLLQKGDGVMSDRGFDITAELQERGCHLYKPPSLGDRKNMTAEEEILTKAIAAARIYVEHAIADIKDNRLLQGVIPLVLEPVIGQLVFIASYLRNFNPTRVRNKLLVTERN